MVDVMMIIQCIYCDYANNHPVARATEHFTKLMRGAKAIYYLHIKIAHTCMHVLYICAYGVLFVLLLNARDDVNYQRKRPLEKTTRISCIFIFLNVYKQ